MNQEREEAKRWFYSLEGKGNQRICPQCRQRFNLADLQKHLDHSTVN